MESGYLRSSDQHHHITVRVRRCPMPSLISPCLPAPCFLPSTLSHDLCSSPWPTMLAPPLPLTVPCSHGFPIILSVLITQFTWPLPNNDLLHCSCSQQPPKVSCYHCSSLPTNGTHNILLLSPLVVPTVSAQTFPRAIPTSRLFSHYPHSLFPAVQMLRPFSNPWLRLTVCQGAVIVHITLPPTTEGHYSPALSRG